MNQFILESALSGKLLEMLLLSTALLLAASVASLCAYRASAAVRHLIWSLAIAGCLLLPILTLVLPDGMTSSLQSGLVISPGTGDQVVPRTSQAADDSGSNSASGTTPGLAVEGTQQRSGERPPLSSVLVEIMTWVWVAGSLLLGGKLLHTIRRINRDASRARPVEDPVWLKTAQQVEETAGLSPGGLRLRRTDRKHSPMVTGLLKPVVLLPLDADQWNEEQRLQVLQHEAAHLRRGDGLTQFLAGMITALYWLNPLVFLAYRQMLIQRERACDDQVLCAGADPTCYAHHLLGMAKNLEGPALDLKLEVAMARRSEMSGRLMAILDTHRNRRSPGPMAWTTSVLTTLVLAVGLAMITPVSQAAPTPSSLDHRSDTVYSAGHPTGKDAEDWSLTEIREAIDLANGIIEQGVADSDVDAMLQPYSSSMVLLAMGGARAEGLRGMREAFNVMVENYRALEIETLEVERITDEVVYEIGRYRYYRGKEPRSLSGRYLSIWHWESGHWRVFRDISNF